MQKTVALFTSDQDEQEENRAKKRYTRGYASEENRPKYEKKSGGQRKDKTEKTDKTGETKKATTKAKRKGRKERKEELRSQEEKELPYEDIIEQKRKEEEEEKQLLELVQRSFKEEKEVFKKVDPENDLGSMEYKLKLANPSLDRVKHLTTQLNFRLNEGYGETTYLIGIEDSGNPLGVSEWDLIQSLKTLLRMSGSLGAEMSIKRIQRGIRGQVAEVVIHQMKIEGISNDIKIMLFGAMGAGKSTLIGVLLSGSTDNGKGLARTNVFRHKHEIINGQTSSITSQIVGLDSKGKITNQGTFGNLTWPEIVDVSSKIITFIDVSGQEKYINTMNEGVCSRYPDYALIVISVETSLAQLPDSQFQLALEFKIPIIILLTKIDLVKDSRELKKFNKELLKILEKKYELHGMLIETKEQILENKENISLTPIIPVSTTTNKNMDLFIHLLNMLRINPCLELSQKDPVEFQIIDNYQVGNSTIIGGILRKGTVSVDQKLRIGPDREGLFREVEIKSIESLRHPVKNAYAGQMCTFSLNMEDDVEKWLRSGSGRIRKGMLLLDINSAPVATRTFEAEIWTLNGKNRMLNMGYKPCIYIQHIKQSCQIMSPPTHILNENVDKEPENLLGAPLEAVEEECKEMKGEPEINIRDTKVLEEVKETIVNSANSANIVGDAGKSSPKISKRKGSKPTLERQTSILVPHGGQKAKITFKFMHYPEYITQDSMLLINDTCLKAFGKIIKVHHDL